jgi:hypothetical protein
VAVSWAGGKERSIDERFADRFAAALLMPASVLRLRFSETYDSGDRFSPRNLVFLARTFNVSVEAMARRLEQLGLLLNGTYESLVERGFSVKAANELLGVAEFPAQGFSPRLTWLALEAYQRDLLTEAQVAEMLGSNRLEVRKMIASLFESSNLKESPLNG